jgi:predicted cobalt transporter CbtA
MKRNDVALAAIAGALVGIVLARLEMRASWPYVIEASLSINNVESHEPDQDRKTCAQCGNAADAWKLALYVNDADETLYFCNEGCLEAFILYGSSLPI